MEVFVVRIYRFKKGNPRALVGLVEIVGKKGRLGFTNMDELWEILNSSMGNVPKGQAGFKKEDGESLTESFSHKRERKKETLLRSKRR
jgi:hypothetical protein